MVRSRRRSTRKVEGKDNRSTGEIGKDKILYVDNERRRKG